MGLLGDSWDDPKTLATLQLAAGLLGPGGLGTGMSRGLLGYQNAMGADTEMQLKKAQLEDIKQQALLRQVQAQRQQGAMEMAAKLMQPPQSTAQTVTPSIMPGSGAISPTVGLQQRQADIAPATPLVAPISSYMSKLNEDQITGLIAAGALPEKAYDIWKLTKFGEQMQPGYRRTVNGTEFLADPKSGINFDPNTKTVTPLAGASNTIANLAAESAGATTGATERAKAPFTFIPSFSNSGQQVGTRSVADLLGMRPGVQPPSGQLGGVATPGGGPGPGFNPTAPSAAEAAKAGANAGFLKKRADDAAAYITNVDNKVNQGAELNMRMQESIKALEQFRAGGGAETRAKLASMAQAIGAPKDVVSGIAGGDLASMQVFNKLAVQQAMETLKSSMDGAGRIAQAEFKVFQANNPNLSTDPEAIRKIFNFNTRVFNRDLQEQQFLHKKLKEGADPTDLPTAWSSEQARQGFTQPELKATGSAVDDLVNKYKSK